MRSQNRVLLRLEALREVPLLFFDFKEVQSFFSQHAMAFLMSMSSRFLGWFNGAQIQRTPYL